MVRSELVEALAAGQPQLSMSEAEKVIDLVFENVIQRLAEGGRVELRGFGAFSTRAREGRIGRNPRTGEKVAVDAKRVVHFKPGKTMRERVDGDP